MLKPVPESKSADRASGAGELHRLVAALRARIASKGIKSFFVSMLSAATSRAGNLVLAIVLARVVGPSGYGTFTFATGTAMLGGNVANLGWPNLTNRVLPGMLKNEEWGLLRGFCRASEFITVLASIVVALLIAAAGYFYPHLQSGLVYAAALVIPFGFMALRRQQLSAVRRPAMGLLFDQGFAAIVSVVILLIFPRQSLPLVFVEYILATVVGVLFTGIVFRRNLPVKIWKARPSYLIRPWLTMSLPMVLGSLGRLMMNKTDILMLAPLSTMHEVGLYGAAFRLTYFMTFPQIVLMTMLTPKLSEAFTHGQFKKIKRLLHIAHWYAIGTAGPIVLVMVIFPQFTMTTVFGPAFGSAGPTLAALALGQGCAAFAVASNSFLMMTGNERAFGMISIGAFIVNVALNLFLIPLYGAFGSGLATLIASVLMLAAEAWLVRRAFQKMV